MGAFPLPFPKRAFPQPFPKGTGDGTFASPSPSGEGWGEASGWGEAPASGEGWGEASSIKKPRTTGNRAGLDCYSISRKRGVTC